MKLLIVDDEPTILETISHKMRKEGFTIFQAETAEDGMRQYRRVKPDLILLDIMLPNRSGTELCRAIRRESSVPIVFVSARASEADRVKGLELGADDYVVKPFNLAELAARVKAILRRSGGYESQELVKSGNLSVDPVRHVVTLDEKSLDLAPKEFALLHFLMLHEGQVFSREALLDRVWGADAYVGPRTVDVHIRWLRARIEPDPANPCRILTVRGLGYKFAG